MRWLKFVGVVMIALLVWAIAHSHNNSSSSAAPAASQNSSSSSAPPAGARGPVGNEQPIASSTPAHITMLRGRTSDNACTESDSEARIYVVITLRNTGDADGTVNPWATFDYSDGGNSTESYFRNYDHYLNVPAHSEVDATFYHTFNPQQHAMIRCAGYADLGDSEATGYYLPAS